MSDQPTAASQYLVELARRLAQPYAALPSARAILLTGSASEGTSDFYSDLDIILYYDRLPSEEELAAAYAHNGGTERAPLAPPNEQQNAESYLASGVNCQFAHSTIAAWEKEMAVVLDNLEVDTPIQKALGGMAEAIPLYGAPLIAQWQARLAAYPDALALAMVNHYLAKYSYWGLLERLKTRDATLWYTEMLVESTQSLLGTLAGLNHLYFTTFQFKRMRRFIEQMTLTPADCANRMEMVFRADPAVAPEQSTALMRETLALIEQHIPDADTSRIQRRLDYRAPAWTPVENKS